MHTFTLLFLLALAARTVTQSWLAARQIAFVRERSRRVPADFAAVVSDTEHGKAAEYTIAKQRLGIADDAYDVVVLLLLTLGGGIAAIGDWAVRLAGPSVAGGTLHVLGVFAVAALAGLPFSIYRTFRLEARFGFNRTTPGVFVADHLKGYALGLLFGGLVTAAVLWIMQGAGPRWWLVGWLAWIGFSLLVTWAWPVLIAPLFNRFLPLEDASLRERIDALLARCGFRAKSVFVMDGSRRSAHGNAYFTGLGREKRIVFFDTLLARLTPPQVESVLAHELAHFKLKHIPQRLAVSAVASLAGFALLGWLARQAWFYEALGVPQPGDASALILFLLVTPVFTWIATPLLAAWSRRHEFEADAFAARHSDTRALADALVALYKDNASTLTPDPLYSAFHDSHPPPAERVARLRGLAAAPVHAS
jgi:STE24 endopeptidase